MYGWLDAKIWQFLGVVRLDFVMRSNAFSATLVM
jgi:hypothetical protein